MFAHTLVCVSTDALLPPLSLAHTHTTHNTHTHTTHHVQRIYGWGFHSSAEQYKVAQVHRVNGSSELIHASRVSCLATHNKNNIVHAYKVKAKRDTYEMQFVESVYIVNTKTALTDLVSWEKKFIKPERYFPAIPVFWTPRGINCVLRFATCLMSRNLYMYFYTFCGDFVLIINCSDF